MNRTPLDRWTLAHLASGALAARLGVPLPGFILGSVLYEAVEHKLESPGGHPFFGSKRPEALANVAVDLAAGALGYQLGRR